MFGFVVVDVRVFTAVLVVLQTVCHCETCSGSRYTQLNDNKRYNQKTSSTRRKWKYVQWQQKYFWSIFKCIIKKYIDGICGL